MLSDQPDGVELIVPVVATSTLFGAAGAPGGEPDVIRVGVANADTAPAQFAPAPQPIATSGRFIGGNGTTLIRQILYAFQIDCAAIARPRRTASSAPMDRTETETVSNANW